MIAESELQGLSKETIQFIGHGNIAPDSCCHTKIAFVGHTINKSGVGHTMVYNQSRTVSDFQEGTDTSYGLPGHLGARSY